MEIRFPYTVTKESDGTLFVQFVDFPEGVTEGETPKEVATNAQDVLNLLVETYAADGRALPPPSPVVGNLFAVVRT